MRYLITFGLVFVLLACCACDNVQILGAINTGSFSGTVSIVRLTVAQDGTQVTFVTLVNTQGSNDYDFCGNVVSQFPLNTLVQGSFRPGTACSTILRISISG